MACRRNKKTTDYSPFPEVPGFTPSGYVRPGKKVAHEMSS